MAARKKKTAGKKVAKRVRSKKIPKKVPKKKLKAKKSKTRRPKTLKKKTVSKPETPKKQVIGVVTHYFPKVEAAVVKLKKPLAIGDTILIKGKTTYFEQKVESMQIDHAPILKAKKGDEIGLGIKERVREHDLVLLPS